MSRPRRRDDSVTPSLLLRAYACGIFPMADSADDPNLFWVEPTLRGVLPLDSFHLPRRLARTVRSDIYEIRVNTDFEAVIDACAASRPGRRATWINRPIRDLYGALFRQGHVHTVETWIDGRLVGGLYGVKLGAAFFGESMFSLARDASKVALVHLAARLRQGGFTLLDTQFQTDHLRQFGTVELNRDVYLKRLADALDRQAEFLCFPGERAGTTTPVSGQTVLQILRPR